MTSAESGEGETGNRSRSSFFTSENNWWRFCLAIIVLKFLLLAVDPTPKFYLGDSRSYLWTALKGWIPADRSYFYGYVVRWVSLWTGNLASLLIVQAFLGAMIAITVAWICRTIFKLTDRLAYLFGFLCAIDPLQLIWERYVMTEAFSLFFYALVLQQSFVYLRDRRLTTLVLIQFLSVITIGFRVVFLVVAQVLAVALPLIAFFPSRNTSGNVPLTARLEFLRRTRFWQHVVTSVVAMFLLDQGYKHTYGFLSHREPAHLYATGYFLLATWAPALQPEDATDPRLAKIIQEGDEYELRDFWRRAGQRWDRGRLIDRWRRAEPDQRKSTNVALQTALNTLRRDPAAVIAIAVKEYFVFWQGYQLKDSARWDLGAGTWKDSELKLLAERFHWAGRADITAEPQTFTKWYYVAAWPFYFVPLLSPLLAFVLLFVTRSKANAWLLFIHTEVLFAVTLLFSIAPIIRYLQPISLLMLLNIALTVKSFSPSGERPRQWLRRIGRRFLGRRLKRGNKVQGLPENPMAPLVMYPP